MAGGPCKPPKTLSEPLRTRGCLCKAQHLGPACGRHFAVRFMKLKQRNAVGMDALEALLPRPDFCFSS